MTAEVNHDDVAIPATRPDTVSVLRRGENTSHREWTARGQWWLRLISPFLLVIAWEVLAQIGAIDRRFFPPPSEIVLAAGIIIDDGALAKATVDSLRRLWSGYLIGAGVGIAVGLWLGLSSWFRALIEPWIQITYPIPKLAVYPLLVLLVGLGEMPIIILLAITVFYIVAINTIAGVLSIRPVLLDVGRDCKATFFQFFRTIALPAAMPHICTSLELSLGLAYIVLIAAEFIGARTGFGAIIWSSWQLFDVAPMYVAIVSISVLGYLSVLGVRFLSDVVMPWRRTHT